MLLQIPMILVHIPCYFLYTYFISVLVSAQVELIYTEKPKIKAIANNVMVRLNTEAVLSCVADGIPSPHISWKRGDQLIEPDSHFDPNSTSLRIPVVSVSDAGEFTCIARNVLGEAMDHIGLFVGHPPTFIQKPRGIYNLELRLCRTFSQVFLN